MKIHIRGTVRGWWRCAVSAEISGVRERGGFVLN